MIVAGLGFRAAASVESLEDALHQALIKAGAPPIDALATAAEKAKAAAMVAMANARGVPVHGIEADELRRAETATASPKVEARFGTGSVAEAAALAAAGPQARLLVERVISSDAMATAAIAEGRGEST